VTDKFNSTLLTSLKFYVNENHSDWAKHLDMIAFTYNATTQTSTGYSPFYLLHGFEPIQPIDVAILPKNPDFDILQSIKDLHTLRKRIPEIFKKAQERQKSEYDKNKREGNYNVGERVFLKTNFTPPDKCRKLTPNFRGPYLITRVIGPLNYELEIPKNGRWVREVVHVEKLRKVK